jgi:hypothetical protein
VVIRENIGSKDTRYEWNRNIMCTIGGWEALGDFKGDWFLDNSNYMFVWIGWKGV